MTSEEILMRQEIRQMLNEVGINKNTLKDMVKVVLEEELQKACKQALEEYNVSKTCDELISKSIKEITRENIRDAVWDRFRRMSVSVDVRDSTGHSSIG